MSGCGKNLGSCEGLERRAPCGRVSARLAKRDVGDADFLCDLRQRLCPHFVEQLFARELDGFLHGNLRCIGPFHALIIPYPGCRVAGRFAIHSHVSRIPTRSSIWLSRNRLATCGCEPPWPYEYDVEEESSRTVNPVRCEPSPRALPPLAAPARERSRGPATRSPQGVSEEFVCARTSCAVVHLFRLVRPRVRRGRLGCGHARARHASCSAISDA